MIPTPSLITNLRISEPTAIYEAIRKERSLGQLAADSFRFSHRISQCLRLKFVRGAARGKESAGWTSCQAGDGAAACERERRVLSVAISHRRSPLVSWTSPRDRCWCFSLSLEKAARRKSLQRSFRQFSLPKKSSHEPWTKYGKNRLVDFFFYSFLFFNFDPIVANRGLREREFLRLDALWRFYESLD